MFRLAATTHQSPLTLLTCAALILLAGANMFVRNRQSLRDLQSGEPPIGRLVISPTRMRVLMVCGTILAACGVLLALTAVAIWVSPH